ncbi:MAG: hypothetical protein K2X01_05310 [Cyanobacteria bacterium]|nr:hypothetical protein [Cyanobacteriota bacterium]
MMKSFQPKTRAKQPGTAMILVLSLITLITIELTTMSLVLTKGIGDEAVLMNQNVSARQITETAVTRMTEQINNVLISYRIEPDDFTNNQSNVTNMVSTLTKGGGNDLSAQTVAITNPESGAIANIKNVTFDAWVSTARPPYYLVNVISNVGSVQLTSKRWVLVQPCPAEGVNKLLVSDTGISSDPGATITDPYRWTNTEGPHKNNYPSFSVADPINGWVAIGTSNQLRLWQSAKGLSVLDKNSFPGTYGGITIDGSRQRIFYILDNTKGANASLNVWNPSTGISQLITNIPSGGPNSPQSLAVDPSSGRVYVGASPTGDGFYVWDDVSGTQTLVASGSGYAEGFRSTVVDPTGRVYFGQNRANGNWYTWHPTTGLSTLLTTEPFPGVASTTVDPISGVVYMAARPANVFGVGSFPNGALLGYKNGKRVLKVDFPDPYLYGVGPNALVVDSKRQRIFMGSNLDSSEKDHFAIWNPAAGLSVMDSDKGPLMSPGSFLLDDSTGAVYFGDTIAYDQDNGIPYSAWKTPAYYTWKPGDTQATQLFDPGDNGCIPGFNNSAVFSSKYQILAVAGPITCGLYVYSPSKGFYKNNQYNVGDKNMLGDNGNVVIDPTTGNIFISDRFASGNFLGHVAQLVRLDASGAVTYTGYNKIRLDNYSSETLTWDSLSSRLIFLDNSDAAQGYQGTYSWSSPSCDRNF